MLIQVPRSPKTLRLPLQLEREIEREFHLRGIREWSAGVVDLLSEAVRMRRVPGIWFVDGIYGRRAAIAGTGLEVWEVIATWKALGSDEERLRTAYYWLTPAQLRAALTYYSLYPEEIDARLQLEENWSPDRIREELRFASLGPGLSTNSQ